MKYALALPPKTPADPATLPQWGITSDAAGRRLWLTFTRRKGVSDVVLDTSFSPGIPAWSNAASTVIEDLGESERVRIEENIPGSAPAQGFLHLAVRRSTL